MVRTVSENMRAAYIIAMKSGLGFEGFDVGLVMHSLVLSMPWQAGKLLDSETEPPAAVIKACWLTWLQKHLHRTLKSKYGSILARHVALSSEMETTPIRTKHRTKPTGTCHERVCV